MFEVCHADNFLQGGDSSEWLDKLTAAAEAVPEIDDVLGGQPIVKFWKQVRALPPALCRVRPGLAAPLLSGGCRAAVGRLLGGWRDLDASARSICVSHFSKLQSDACHRCLISAARARHR